MNETGGYHLEDLTVGLSAQFMKTLSERDVLQFASASGDHNPVHLDEEYARQTASSANALRTECSPPRSSPLRSPCVFRDRVQSTYRRP